MNIPWRKIHRWLGLCVGFQVVAWMLSGLYFALIPIEEIRGEHLTRPVATIALNELAKVGEPALVLAAITAISDDQEISKFELRKLRNRLVYRVEFEGEDQSARLFDAATGLLLPRLESAEAATIVQDALLNKTKILSVDLVTQPIRGGEFRGRALPVYRVIPDSDNDLHVYVDAWTGEIVARRSSQWRLFDLLWALHIMDFQDRDDFNHPLLIVFAAAALVLSVGGYILWWISSIWVRRRRHNAIN